ncbi:hypothetical protein KSD_55480 [Ktedonobacter sp. SOSP1-85]|nr:hypothetical protein KSD_55480 [Ktedonobacter sp. SOSP1-85]
MPENNAVLVFFLLLTLGMVADPEHCPNMIDLADTDAQIKTLSQFCLDGR